MGEWEVMALRVCGLNPMKAQEILIKCPKTWIVKAFTTKLIFED